VNRWFWLLSQLLPVRFRERFGDEVIEHAELECRAAFRRGPVRGVARWSTTSLDLAITAASEHLNPAWGGAGTNRGGHGGGEMIAGLIREVRMALRTLARSPGFTVTAVFTLSLALGASTAIFSVVDGVLLEPLPWEDPDGLVYIAASSPGSDLPDEFGLSEELFRDYRDQSRTLEAVGTFNLFTASFRTPDRVERLPMSVPTHSVFEMLGATPVLGRLPSEGDEDVVLISHALWTDWFGQDPDVVGRAYEVMDGQPREVVGVMGPDFDFPREETMVWIPQTRTFTDFEVGRFGMAVIGRVAPGQDRESVTTELASIAAGVPERWGGSPRYAEMMEAHIPVVRSLEEELLGDLSLAIWVLLTAVLTVLAIACANVANLFAVRAEGRGRDLAVRRAIGAGRRQLARGQFVEALVVAAAAGGGALVIAWFAVPALIAAAPARIPRIDAVALNGSSALFVLAAALLTGLACGVAPAIRASRPDLGRLRDGTRGSTTGRHRIRDLLVVGQTAMALVLLVGSGLLMRSYQELRSVDPGFDPEGVFTFQFAPEEAHLTDGPSWAAFHLDFMDQLRALRGVESVGIVENVPIDEGPRGIRISTGENPDPEASVLASLTFAGGDYFSTMGISIEEGRGFTDEDARIAGRAVISRALADQLWPGESPVGRQVRVDETSGWHEVVGVAEDVLQFDLRGQPEPLVYYPLVGPPETWALTSPGYVVKTSRLESIAPDVRALIREVTPSAPMYRTYTMQGLLDDTVAPLSFTMMAIGFAAAMSLLLGAIGLYGVLSYVVSQRAREIGVRMALGAEGGRVQKMVVLQGARVVGLGVAIGVLAAFGLTRLMSGLLFGVAPLDPTTFISVAALMMAVGLMASWLPARRASMIDPILSMREG